MAEHTAEKTLDGYPIKQGLRVWDCACQVDSVETICGLVTKTTRMTEVRAATVSGRSGEDAEGQ